MPMLNNLFIVSNQGGIKDAIDKRLFKFKINAIVGICKDYLDYRIMHFSFVDAMYCFSMDKDNALSREPEVMIIIDGYVGMIHPFPISKIKKI